MATLLEISNDLLELEEQLEELVLRHKKIDG